MVVQWFPNNILSSSAPLKEKIHDQLGCRYCRGIEVLDWYWVGWLDIISLVSSLSLCLLPRLATFQQLYLCTQICIFVSGSKKNHDESGDSAEVLRR